MHPQPTKIVWFNPPFYRNVNTNMSWTFLRLFSKQFPWNYTMHMIFNRNTVKISYGCLTTISFIISSHNRNILSSEQQSFGCNCKKINEFPLNGEFQTPSVTYWVDVDSDYYIYTNLPVSDILRLSHPRSEDSQGQETFLYIYTESSTVRRRFVKSRKSRNITLFYECLLVLYKYKTFELIERVELMAW